VKRRKTAHDEPLNELVASAITKVDDSDGQDHHRTDQAGEGHREHLQPRHRRADRRPGCRGGRHDHPVTSASIGQPPADGGHLGGAQVRSTAAMPRRPSVENAQPMSQNRWRFLRQPPLPRRQGRQWCPELVSEINVAQPL
jgi:hypothetical protein